MEYRVRYVIEETRIVKAPDAEDAMLMVAGDALHPRKIPDDAVVMSVTPVDDPDEN